uniref:RNase H type-1 domain-containing protein n=1 Tax=Arundo donax TaxID=35708 RepID=A0A0A9AFF7_ARUDO
MVFGVLREPDAQQSFVTPSGQKLQYSVLLKFKITNNAAEYKGILLGLRKAKALRAQCIIFRTDSQLVAGQVSKDYQARDPKMTKYVQAVRLMEKHFLGFEVRSIPRAENEQADIMAKATMQGAPGSPTVLHKTLTFLSTLEGARLINVMLLASEEWCAPIRAFIEGRYEPTDKVEEQRIRHRTRGYVILNDVLYEGDVCEPYLLCLSKNRGRELLKEIHQGLCASHLAPKSLVSKDFSPSILLAYGAL